MNLIQMLCCALIVKSSEISQQYLAGQTETIQQTLRARRVQTAQEASRFIDSLIQEAALSGGQACSCQLGTSVGSPTPEPAPGRRMSWRKAKNEQSSFFD